MAIAQLNRTLSERQTQAIITFLQTLTGEYRGAPVIGAMP
jgi:cytochrome c peroxidase